MVVGRGTGKSYGVYRDNIVIVATARRTTMLLASRQFIRRMSAGAQARSKRGAISFCRPARLQRAPGHHRETPSPTYPRCCSCLVWRRRLWPPLSGPGFVNAGHKGHGGRSAAGRRLSLRDQLPEGVRRRVPPRKRRACKEGQLRHSADADGEQQLARVQTKAAACSPRLFWSVG